MCNWAKLDEWTSLKCVTDTRPNEHIHECLRFLSPRAQETNSFRVPLTWDWPGFGTYLQNDWKEPLSQFEGNFHVSCSSQGYRPTFVHRVTRCDIHSGYESPSIFLLVSKLKARVTKVFASFSGERFPPENVVIVFYAAPRGYFRLE